MTLYLNGTTGISGVDGSAGTPAVQGTDTNTGISFPAADTIAVNTGGSERVRCDSSGRVGIGTTSPGAMLTVGGVNRFEFDNTNNNIHAYTNNYYIYGIRSNSNSLELDSPFGGNIIFRAQNLGTASSPGTATERARIDTSGRFLVGTSTSPSSGDSQYARLRVQGNTLNSGGFFALARNDAATSIVSGHEIGHLFFTDNAGNGFASIKCEADANAGTNDYPGRLMFSTTADGASSPTERMRIDQNGNIKTYSTGNGHTVNVSAGAGTSTFIHAGNRSSTDVQGSGGTTVYYVYSNGTVQNATGTYTTISDAKLKENIVDANSQWDDLKAIQIRNWNFKAETGHETHRQIGPIAQELEAVCPGLVFETPDRDADGNETGEVTKGVNQSVLYMKAVKALQEAMERIEQLEAKVAALESA